MQEWTKVETDLLKHRYSTLGAVGVAYLLPKRTLRAIRNKASKLGLRFQESYEHPKEAHRNARFKYLYKITLREYNHLLIKQGGVCAVCEIPEPGRRLCVDHDHQTGRVRGLLCRKCNSAIGLLNDDIKLLRRTIAYLKGGD